MPSTAWRSSSVEIQRERIAGRDVRLLSGVHARELDVHVARVAGVAAALDHVQQAVGVERVAPRQREPLARRERARVRRVGVERDHRASELIAQLRRLQPHAAPSERAV